MGAKMKIFEVLNKELDINQSYFLEASAGTGKTFAIENIILRLLLETDPPISIDQLLVVTFTNAAAVDLKFRIKQNLERNYDNLLSGIQENLPNYFQEVIKKDFRQVKRKLEEALYLFDQTQIKTIHGFCLDLLQKYAFEANIHLESLNSLITYDEIEVVISDFFRVGLEDNICSQVQLEKLLNDLNHDFNLLKTKLTELIVKSSAIASKGSFFELFKKFQENFLNHRFEYCQLKNDLELLLPNYKKCSNYQEEINSLNFLLDLFKKENVSKSDFDYLINNGSGLYKIFQEGNKKSKVKEANTFYPHIVTTLQNIFGEIIERARSPIFIFCELAHHCQKFYQNYLKNHEKFHFDQLLIKVKEAILSSSFKEEVRKNFYAVIIDEFQDTDPIQWDIFSKLFIDQADWKGKIYLVGDPKQSIYAFRQADIYTYLTAANCFSENSLFSLNVNYRSAPNLVKGLNVIFHQDQVAKLFSLPKINSQINYPPVHFIENNAFTIKDDFGSIHLMCVSESIKSKRIKNIPIEEYESNYFFPFFAKELKKLHSLDIAYKDIAILVKDKFQGDRVNQFLKKSNIGSSLQKNKAIQDSYVLTVLIELLEAVNSYKNTSLVKVALAGPFFRYDLSELFLLNQLENFEKVIIRFHELHEILNQEGFSKFIDNFIYHPFLEDQIPLKTLLSTEDGDSFLFEFRQLLEIILAKESECILNPEFLISFLKELQQQKKSDISIAQDVSQDVVQIITTHSSKGLEYKVIFALSLISRTNKVEALVSNNNQQLEAVLESSIEYIRLCEEKDAEKMRLLYVALTRAKYRIYLPILNLDNCPSANFGSASPMELYLAQFRMKYESYSSLYQNLVDKDHPKRFLEFCMSQEDEIFTLSQLLPCPYEIVKAEQRVDTINISSIEPFTKDFFLSPIYIQSFNSLAKKGKKINLFLPNPNSLPISNENEKNINTLPLGRVTGNILHTILEKIPFELIKKVKISDELIPYINPYCSNSTYEGWQKVIAEMVYNAFNAILNDFSLKDVDEDKIFREIEFTLTVDQLVDIGELTASDLFLKGVIDLVFFHNNKYYLIDWKTNWLGNNFEDYSFVNMQQEMIEQNYFLQANIYKHALRKYLKLFEKRNFEDCFGGIFYIFLRGVRSNSKQGLFFLNSQGCYDINC
ncbi:Exodeoxyribonuclease V beta chain [Candidatus Rubidus massiliensis]|nr:Exodeoxyribonuclease V beta chain [Candidatus Rubidus massiliensis]